MNIEYKGFTITTFTSEGKERFNIEDPSDCFNQGGYASLNAAKGAITKHLNAPSAKASTSDDKDRATVHADASRTTALLRYRGLVDATGVPRSTDKRSRNKREGGYAGKVTLYANRGGVIKKFRTSHVRSGNGNYLYSLKDQARHMDTLDQAE